MSSSTIEVTDLNEDERNIYLSEKLKKFNITIIICTIYAIIATVLLLVAYFTSWGKKYLYDEMLAFVVTYIIGTIIIVVYLANEVYNYKPIKGQSLNYNSDLCPDYWKLVYVDNNSKEFMLDQEGKNYFNPQVNTLQFRYKCVMDDTIYDKNNLKVPEMKKNIAEQIYIEEAKDINTKLSNDNDLEKFKQHSATMLGYKYDENTNKLSMNSSNAFFNNVQNARYFSGEKIPIACDFVYPMYLSLSDVDYQNKNPGKSDNTFRCAYAQACGITWTDAGCRD
jgi:hypothetical protein